MWRDVRKDTLEMFRKVFMYLEEIGLLDMDNKHQRICLYIVYQPRIQASLDRTIASWNRHRLRTEHNKSPMAIYELSRERAQTRGYWHSDPGDDLNTASDPTYGQEDGQLPPLDELASDPSHGDYAPFNGSEEEREAGIFVNEDEEIEEGRKFFSEQGFDCTRDDTNWGIDVFCEAVMLMQSRGN
jgi:hypothetical protein